MNFKTISTQIKAESEKNIVSGYGSIFGNVDSHNDIVMKGAFAKTLKERKSKIKMLWQHDLKEPIGKMLDMYEDEKGLFFQAKVSDTDMGKKAMILMRDGVIDELSIGYHTIKEDYDSKKNVNYLKELKLYEISTVTFASNPLAQLTDVKALLSEYQYSNGNVMDIVAMELLKSIKALIGNNEPSIDTQKAKESQDIEVIMAEIKKYL
jgi:hypothetical protein